jgi:CCR4-NOT transcription complex subunit 10
MALQHAEQLLKQPRLSGAHRYLGHLYLAEAMVTLDRIADSVSHLNPDNVTDISTLFPEHKEQDKSEKNGEKDSQESSEAKGALYPWSPRDVPQARAVMQYNLAAAHAIRGEYEKASMHLAQSIQSIGSPPPVQMYFLMLYLELMEGRHKNAHQFIREHFGHVTLNR